jgi:outer membrane protein TolC
VQFNKFYLTTALLHFLCAFTGSLCAQQTDYDIIVQPLEAKARDFSEYLVQLAWQNNPESAIALDQKVVAQETAKNIHKEWMRDIQATFNLNEANLRSRDSSSNVFFPRYNFGISLNLYNATSQKTKNKIGKKNIEIADQKVNQRKLQLREETLTRYAQYKLAKLIYEKRTLAEQDIYTNYLLIQQLYKTDEKTLEEYTLASSAYYEAQESRLKADTDVQLARLSLESIIGLKWEQVQHPAKTD